MESIILEGTTDLVENICCAINTFYHEDKQENTFDIGDKFSITLKIVNDKLTATLTNPINETVNVYTGKKTSWLVCYFIKHLPSQESLCILCRNQTINLTYYNEYKFQYDLINNIYFVNCKIKNMSALSIEDCLFEDCLFAKKSTLNFVNMTDCSFINCKSKLTLIQDSSICSCIFAHNHLTLKLNKKSQWDFNKAIKRNKIKIIF